MIKTGIDILAARPPSSQRIGLVTNEAAYSSNGSRSRVHLLDAGFRVVKLFSPEHGLPASGVDGARQEDTIDTVTGLPVISLYGDRLAPAAQDLTDIDLVVFDVPDVGCRFYTYLWTLTYVMEACAASGKGLMVLDRPNPIGADLSMAEGPLLDEKHCSSFIGRWPMPLRHSCTLGELARYFAATRVPGLQLEVIPVENWDRRLGAQAAGWHFRSTSPAIRDEETALLYPGTGLLEGISVSEGRGTDKPFRQFGAPWIQAAVLRDAFKLLSLPGIEAGIARFTPAEGPYRNEYCEGLALSVVDKAVFRPVFTGIALIQLLLLAYPAQVKERLYPTVANPSGALHLDKLLGIPNAFNHLQSGRPVDTQVAGNWETEIRKHLLY